MCVSQLERADGVELTGSALWDAGLALGDYARKLRPRLGEQGSSAPLSVIEIGAGCGAAGLMLALGGDEILLTDYQPEVLALLETNVRRNWLQGCASVQKLDWNDPPSLAIARRPWDLILCADIIYGLPSFAPLLQLLEALCSPRTRILLGCGNKQRGSREVGERPPVKHAPCVCGVSYREGRGYTGIPPCRTHTVHTV